MAERKKLAYHSLETKHEKDLEVNSSQFFDESLSFPKRPPWDFDLGKEKLEAQEERYFIVCNTIISQIRQNSSYILIIGIH